MTVAISLISLGAAAQVTKASSEDLMDAAFDMKKASLAADKLAADGFKYCRWSLAELDTSDLDVAVSRFLLNHGSQVPENLSASKMWRVSLLTRDLVNQLAMGSSMCNLRIRFSDEARRVGRAASSSLLKLMVARSKFNDLAYQQTKRQESIRGPEDKERSGEGSGKVATKEILVAALEMKAAGEIEGMLAAKSQTTSGCLHSDPTEPIDWSDLTKLIDYMNHISNSPSTIPPANMWGVALEAEVAELSIFRTLDLCTPYAAEKKKARNVATESSAAYHRLRVAITVFEALALRQTEWEEQVVTQKQELVQEQ